MRRLVVAVSLIALSSPALAQFGPPRPRPPAPVEAPPPAPRPPGEDDGVPMQQAVAVPDARELPPPAASEARAPVVATIAEHEDDLAAVPGTARAVADAVGAMADAILDIRVDRIRDAVDPDGRDRNGRYYDWRDRDRREARTLGDLVARDDPYFRERLRSDAERAARVAGTAARTAREVEPELRRVADEFGRRIEDAIARAAAD